MNEILLDMIRFDRALFEQNNKFVVVREYLKTYGRYPMEESLIYDMSIKIYENNKYHIIGSIAKDYCIIHGRIISDIELNNIDPISIHKTRRITKRKYWLKSGWYTTKERSPLDVIHYGYLTIIKSDYRTNETEPIDM